MVFNNINNFVEIRSNKSNHNFSYKVHKIILIFHSLSLSYYKIKKYERFLHRFVTVAIPKTFK